MSNPTDLDTNTPLLHSTNAPPKLSLKALHTHKSQNKSTNQLSANKSSLNSQQIQHSQTLQIDHSTSANGQSNTIASAKSASLGHLSFLQNRWTDMKENSGFIARFNSSKHLTPSKREEVTRLHSVNEVWDAVKYGYCKAPKTNYNPYVRTSLIRAAVSAKKVPQKKLDRMDSELSESDNTDTSVDKNLTEREQKHIKEEKILDEIETVQTTLPIYNGGNNVLLRECDRNRHTFPLKQSEWITSWLSFEVKSDKILTHNDDFIGAVSIDLTGIKEEGQMYYTELPLINRDKNYSRKQQQKIKEKKAGPPMLKRAGTKTKLDLFKEKASHVIGYQKIPSHASEDGTETSERDKDLAIPGRLHVTAIKKLTEAGKRDVFTDPKNKTYELEVTILGITDITTLKVGYGMDKRKFYGGILSFVAYLLFYAIVMFLAEIETSTGMNQYKESIWFALVTVTTLGYGDIYAQTPYSKVLNALFITVNVILIAGFVSSLLGYIVDAGEEALDHRMAHTMNGAGKVYENQQKANEHKLKRVATRKRLKLAKEKKRKLSMPEIRFSAKNKNGHKRRSSEPINELTLPINEMRALQKWEESKEEKFESAQKEAKEIEVRTTKATKLKLVELSKFDRDERKKLKTQIYINLLLFALVVLFGFFTLGVAILLTGPNYLTNLPYFGYECQGDDDPFCKLHKSPSSVFVDSLYYTIVSMTTVGYGDIYPQSGAVARVLGSLFILFGTLMVVRLLDQVSGFMIWKQNLAKKKRNYGQILTSTAEFFEFDIDNNGSVDKYEFLVGMLIKLDLMDMERVEEIMEIFNKCDIDGDGHLTKKELKAKIDEEQKKLQWGNDAFKQIDQQWTNIKIAKEQLKQKRQKYKDLEKREKDLDRREEDLHKKEKEVNKRETELLKQINANVIKEESGESVNIVVHNNK